MSEITKIEMRKRLDVIIELASEIQDFSIFPDFDGNPFRKHFSDINRYVGLVKLDMESLGMEVPKPVVQDPCTHPGGYIKSVRICGLCGEQV